MISLRAATDADAPRIRGLLERNGLPTSDLDSARPAFLVACESDEIVGAGALQLLGAAAVLRSLAVERGKRREGLGRRIVHALERHAREMGVSELVLLTQTAAAFFDALGYRVIERQSAPLPVHSCEEFRSICPASAVCMSKSLAPAVEVRSARPEDAAQVCDIYNHYVDTSTITFEEDAVSVAEMAQRIREVQSIPYPWLVATDGASILGYAYASRWKTRAAYRHACEITVYVRATQERTGIGSALYGRLLSALKAAGVHTAIGGVALPNEASVRLHEKFGFQKCAHFRQVGFKFNRWIDVAYWERLL